MLIYKEQPQPIHLDRQVKKGIKMNLYGPVTETLIYITILKVQMLSSINLNANN